MKFYYNISSEIDMTGSSVKEDRYPSLVSFNNVNIFSHIFLSVSSIHHIFVVNGYF